MFDNLQNSGARKNQRVCFLIIVVLVALVIFLCIAIKPAKGEEIAVVKDGHLIISETKQIADIPGVPKELWEDPITVLKLYHGELKSKTIVLSGKKEKFYFSFPFFINNELIWEKQDVSFVQGSWKFKQIDSEIYNFWSPPTTFFILAPILLIWITSFSNQKNNFGTGKLLLFYGVVLACMMLTSVLFLGSRTNGYFFVVVSIVSIVAIAETGFKVANFRLSRLLNGLLGFISFCSVALLTFINRTMPWNFLLFITIVELLCFATASGVAFYLTERELAKKIKTKARFFEVG
jgi:hypothetical protein